MEIYVFNRILADLPTLCEINLFSISSLFTDAKCSVFIQYLIIKQRLKSLKCLSATESLQTAKSDKDVILR